MIDIVDHEDAAAFAVLKRDESNLARCYLDSCEKLSKLVAALSMYADEGFYHGITILADKPTGGFDDDVSLDDGSEYGYPKPGKLARETLRECFPVEAEVNP